VEEKPHDTDAFCQTKKSREPQTKKVIQEPTELSRSDDHIFLEADKGAGMVLVRKTSTLIENSMTSSRIITCSQCHLMTPGVNRSFVDTCHVLCGDLQAKVKVTMHPKENMIRADLNKNTGASIDLKPTGNDAKIVLFLDVDTSTEGKRDVELCGDFQPIRHNQEEKEHEGQKKKNFNFRRHTLSVASDRGSSSVFRFIA
jgi:hypothetical protein